MAETERNTRRDVQLVPMSALRAAPWNPRVVRDERFKALVASVQRDPDFLWARPVLAMGDGTIYAGHMRYRAAQQLGWDAIPAIVGDVSEQLAKERALRDNVNAGEWADDSLATLLAELQDGASDLDALGFADIDLDALMTPSALPSVREESIALSELRAHPRNYRKHPEDQLEHLVQSLRDYGIYRKLVISRDNVILAGHALAQALRMLDVRYVRAIRVDFDSDDARALKLVVVDNEIGHLAEIDDRALTDALREIKDSDRLLGTGFDEAMLANLVFVTRPESEVKDKNEAEQWVGLPEYVPNEKEYYVQLSFRNLADRDACFALLGITQEDFRGRICRWPLRGKEDVSSLRFAQSAEREETSDE